jgi:hypothetical protein
LNVLVPQRGYWAKAEAGHTVKKTPLPAMAERTTTEFRQAPKRGKTAVNGEDLVWLEGRVAFEADPAYAIDVIERPWRWHAEIAPLAELLEQEGK